MQDSFDIRLLKEIFPKTLKLSKGRRSKRSDAFYDETVMDRKSVLESNIGLFFHFACLEMGWEEGIGIERLSWIAINSDDHIIASFVISG